MPPYKIVASDLDGTLLNNAVEVSEENKAAIAEMDGLGVHFVPCSGRAISEIPQIVRSIPKTRYLICGDGAMIYDQQEERPVDCCYMNAETSKMVLDMLFSYQTLLTVRYQGLSYVDEALHDWDTYGEYRLTGNYRKFIYEYDKPIPNFKQFCYDLPGIEMICVFFKSNREMAECKTRLLETGLVQVASSEPYNLEVFDRTAGKGNAILRLAAHLGIDPKQTIGVGDSPNDLDGIRKAGLGLAMENACELLKAEADRIICNNDQHAMQYVLENFIKKD